MLQLAIHVLVRLKEEHCEIRYVRDEEDIGINGRHTKLGRSLSSPASS